MKSLASVLILIPLLACGKPKPPAPIARIEMGVVRAPGDTAKLAPGDTVYGTLGRNGVDSIGRASRAP